MAEKLKLTETQIATRAFPFALRTPNAILKSLDEKNGSLPVIEVYLGHKREDSLYSPNMLAPIGGVAFPDETNLQTAYRRVMAETALSCSPIVEREQSSMVTNDSFEYGINRAADKNREIHFALVPVISPHIVTGIFPVQEDSKIDKLIGMTIKEFKQSVAQGYYEGYEGKFELQGHITKLPHPADTDIKGKNIGKRDRMLDFIVDRLETQEIKAKSKLYRQLFNHTKYFERAKNVFLDFSDLPNDDKIIMESNSLKQVMIELHKKLGVLFAPIFKKAYATVISEFYMEYFREREKKFDHINIMVKDDLKRLKDEAEIIKERFLYKNFAVDILHFLPLYINQEDSIKGKSTRLITESARFLRDLFRTSTKEIFSVEKQRDLESKSEFELRKFNRLKDYFLSTSYLLQNKLNVLGQIDDNLIKTIAEIFSCSVDHVRSSWVKASRFIPDLADETKNSNNEFSSMYQFHELRNEITNASLGQALLISLGIDIKSHKPKEMSLLKFEALRQLLIFLKILLIEPTYSEIIDSKPNPVDFAISKYFGSVQQTAIINLNSNSNGMEKQMPITYRKGLSNKLVIIDEKPHKSRVSIIRKSFEEPFEEIVDVFSSSVVLPNDAYKDLSFVERVNVINEEADNFKRFLEENYPTWEVRVLEDKNKFDNYYQAMNGQDFSRDGKRTGSKGDLLIRRKIKFQIVNPEGQNFFYEMVFYPYETFSDKEHIKEQSLGLMAWKEKIEDDPSYALKRILFPLRGALGLHSLYELFHPASVYPHRINAITDKTVRVFKST